VPDAQRAAETVIALFLAEAETASDEGRFAQALAATGRAISAAEQAGDALLVVRALDAERRILRSSDDHGGALVRSTRILAMAEDPATRDVLDGPTATRAIANAYLEFAFSGRMHGGMSLRELLKVLDAADAFMTATGHRDWRAGVLMERAEIHSALGDKATALTLAQAAVAAYQPTTPGFSAASYRNCLGSFLADVGRNEEAAGHFEAVLADQAAQIIDRMVARNHLARAALDAGDNATAARHAQAAIDLAEGYSGSAVYGSWGLLARARLAAGEHDAAWQAAEAGLAAAQRAGGHSMLYYATRSAFDVAFGRSDIPGAIGLVEELAGHAAALDQAQGRTTLTREAASRRRRLASSDGKADWAAEQYDKALAEFGRAIEAEPDSVHARTGRGETYRLMGRHEDAVADFTAAIALDPAHAWALGSRGQAYRSLKRMAEAIEDLSLAIEIDPEMSWALDERGRALRDAGRYDEALADFNQVIKETPRATWSLAGRGETYRLMGRYEDAVTDFTAVVEIDPRHSWALGSRGQAYRAMGRHEAAVFDFSRAIDIDSSAGWLLSGRGEAYRLMGRNEAAVADFTAAIGLDREHAWALGSRGQAYRALQRLPEAIEDLSRAVALDPSMTWASAELDRCYKDARRLGYGDLR
jgi:tetratricopeptide (TPR) repeat protein